LHQTTASIFIVKPKLSSIKGANRATTAYEFYKVSLFDYLSLLQNDNPIDAPDGRKPVSNDQRGLIYHQCLRALHDEVLGLRNYGRARLKSGQGALRKIGSGDRQTFACVLPKEWRPALLPPFHIIAEAL
jgi:hypothetical protein